MEKIQAQCKEIRIEIEDDQDEFVERKEALTAVAKKHNKTLDDLVTLINDTVDDCIFAVRRKYTDFDNSWLPTEEFPLEAASHFIKYVGFNTLVVQDVSGTIYYLAANSLQLVNKSKISFKVMDAFGSKDYICLALSNKKLQVVSRKTWDMVKAINTQEQIYCLCFNDNQFFQACGQDGFRVFYDSKKGFKAEKGKPMMFDIKSAATSLRFGNTSYGLHAQDEIFTDFEFDGWIKIDEARTSFYKFTWENEESKILPVRLKGLDFTNMKQVVAHPNFNTDEESSVVAYMDREGNVFLKEVQLLDSQYNE